ncbi:hypothetical protein G2W53_005741 [Senna tora]|uniref:Uncharacterized protein n=1 Tax=Senna tora TaxID=362788 RepID=A0A834X3L1_9FABA|nr:hypothetical protein G2W53_005741 [Senna tora]
MEIRRGSEALKEADFPRGACAWMKKLYLHSSPPKLVDPTAKIIGETGRTLSRGHGTSEKCGSYISCRSINYYYFLSVVPYAYCHVREMWYPGMTWKERACTALHALVTRIGWTAWQQSLDEVARGG